MEEIMQRTDGPRRQLWTSIAAIGMSFLLGNGLLIPRPVVVAAEDLAKEAATVEEVAKALDLRTLPLPAGATVDGERSLGMLNYMVGGDPKSAFAFGQQQLVKSGWKELPGSRAEAAYSMGSFQKSNFIVSLSCYDSGDPNKKAARVSISHLGNVRLSKVPVVKGAKSQFVMDSVAAYLTTLKPADAAAATRKLLMDAGWEPYGSVSTPPNSESLTSGNVLQVRFPAGKGKAAAEFIRDKLLAADWEADEDDTLDKTSGNMTFTKADKKMTLSYVDTGLTDVNLMLIGMGVKLETGQGKPER
jgi:hypothetical protein